jgi:hypothetical protein
VLSAYGVNDPWQLVERVSGLYLGGSVNSVRQRTLAQAGAAIIQWLAAKQHVLANPTAVGIDFTQETQLASNVERWLAVTGTDDQSTERYAEPISVAQQPTIPNLSLAGVPDALQSILPRMNNGQLAGLGQIPNLATPPLGKA